MSLTRDATRSYVNFFGSCLDIAICPYTWVLEATRKDAHNYKPEDLALGIGLCVFFSTVVPILPTITSFTITVASFLASVALASMIVVYPFTVVCDVVNNAFARTSQSEVEGANSFGY